MGKTSFNAAYAAKMTKPEFVKLHDHIKDHESLKGKSLGDIYDELTKKTPTPEAKSK